MTQTITERQAAKPDIKVLLEHAATVPLMVFAASLIVRLIDIGSRPFWLDEIFTLERVNLPTKALVHDSFINHHMPSFFLMLAPLAGLGDPQFWLRVPSAIFGAASVMMVYLIAKQIAGRNAGFFAALIIGLSPTALAFSQEARSYTMEMSLILVALFGVAQLAMDIPAASLPMRAPGSLLRAWLTFILGSAAALDVLGDGLPWLITANLIGGVFIWQSRQRRNLALNLLMADAIIGLLSAPLYVSMALTQDKGFVDSVMWIPPLNLQRFWYDVSSIYLMRIADSVTFKLMDVPTPTVIMWLIEAGLVGAVGAGIWRLRRRPALLAAVGLSFIVLPLFLVLISIWRPVLLPRYILWSSAPFAILAGIGAGFAVQHFSRMRLVMMFGGVVALFVVNLFPYYNAETKPRWDIAARILASNVEPGDVVIFNDKGALPILRAYLPAGTQDVVLHDSDGDLLHAQQAEMQGKRVWVVLGHAGQARNTKHELVDNYAQLAPLGEPSEIQMAGGRIYINLFDANHPAAPTCVSQPIPVGTGSSTGLTLPPVPCS